METDKTQPGCFSISWEMSAPECGGCFIRKECERATKRRESGAPPLAPEEPVVETPEPEEQEEVNPLNHFLLGLQGKFDRRDRIGDNAVGHFFGEGEVTIVLVTVSKTSGRIRVQAKEFERILDGIETVEQAEELLHDVLG